MTVQDLAVVDHRLFAVGSEGVVAFGAGLDECDTDPTSRTPP